MVTAAVTESSFVFQVSGVGYNECGHVTMAGQMLTPNSNLSITKVLEVRILMQY